MAPLLKGEQRSDVPSSTDISHEDFIKYRDLWMLYRSVGRYDSNGVFVPPISFLEASQLPKRMVDTFLDLDSFFERMRRHQEKKRKKK